jgi:hypothetical protein
MNDNFPVKQILRGMAWERAKGELQSILSTFSAGEQKQFDKLSAAIDSFVSDVEDNGLAE